MLSVIIWKKLSFSKPNIFRMLDRYQASAESDENEKLF
jgi:hypothetical protein